MYEIKLIIEYETGLTLDDIYRRLSVSPNISVLVRYSVPLVRGQWQLMADNSIFSALS